MTKRKTAFVLSGGGAKGAFEAGALSYLIKVKSICPDIVTGTSAGAICGAVISAARTQPEFFAVADQLHDDILRLSVPGAGFSKQPWLSGLDGTPAGTDIENLIRGRARPPIPPDPTMDTDVLADASTPDITLQQGWDDLRSLLASVVRQHKALRDFSEHDSSAMLLDPLESAFRGRSPGVGPSRLDEAAVGRAGLQLRLTVTALNDACIRYVTEAGTIVEVDAVTPAPGAPAPGVISGVLASASVPMVFEPRKLGDDVYVDGGVLENIPLRPAVQLGGQDLYVMLADPLRCPPPPVDYATTDMFRIYIRAMSSVAFYDQQRRDMINPLPDGTSMTLIDPTVVVLSTFETAAGLLTIDMDYGWLRAAGEVSDLAADDKTKAHNLADRIIIGRMRSWYLEEGLGGTGEDHDAALKSAKNLVRNGLKDWQALGLPIPEGADNWYSGAEIHS
ncbi:MAG: patatin-like phospholipase family protein [Actinomycetes bacterium]